MLAPNQASDLPVPVLEKIKEAAQLAFYSMQPSGPLLHHSKIFQGPNELYIKFIEKLRLVIELQLRREQSCEDMLEQLAFMNANEKCQATIPTLPLKPSPTVDDMLNVCEKHVPHLSSTESQRGRKATITAAETAVEPATPSAPPRTLAQKKCSFRGAADRLCVLCGPKGHWCQQCPRIWEFNQFLSEKKGEEGGNTNRQSKN